MILRNKSIDSVVDGTEGGQKYLTVGLFAHEVGASVWQMRRFYETGYLHCVRGPRYIKNKTRQNHLFPIEEVMKYKERWKEFRALYYSRVRMASRLGCDLDYLSYCYTAHGQYKIFGFPAPQQTTIKFSRFKFVRVDRIEAFEAELERSLDIV